ncbi:hypothetical protein IMCC3317_20950 [Kordia antarctica]|uniref:Uncharacterized protein n=1 Tax=Kordia antarctica TaxID=1218801 RepID=A0A7L4ZJD7_9FLAO|nr:hypothetical protein [Kordia antarctica]QHI36725.1 hypothetical protein IMCC3317_20950 [Kordia antarctica]
MNQFLNDYKQYLLVVLLLIGVYSCQNDETIQNEPEQETRRALDFEAKKVKMHTLFQENKELDRFISQNFLSNELSHENVNATMYGFSIDTTNVQVISSNSFNSYTFIVNRDEAEENMLENYVLTVFSNGDYSQMLVSYPYTYVDDEIQYSINSSTAQFIVDDTLLLNESSSPCPSTQAEIIDWEDIECVAVNCGEVGNHPPGQQCEDGTQRSYWECTGGWVVIDCVQPSSGSSAGDGAGPFTNPAGGGVDTNDDTIDDEIPVMPMIKTSLEEVIGCMNKDGQLNQEPKLTQGMITWLQNNRFTTNLVNNFLKLNNCSDSAVDIAKFAIKKLIDNGEVNFEDILFKDESFKDSGTDCIHNSLMETDNFYSELISKFFDNSGKVMTFEIGSVPTGDWGVAKGSSDNDNEFIVTMSEEIENGSSLQKKLTLCHEVVHVYMFNALENWGLINFDINGLPILSIDCLNGINYNSIDLNQLSIQNRFAAIICAYNQNSTLTDNWTHEIFSAWNFDVDTYTTKIKDFLLNNHDWENENEAFKNEAIGIFGAMNWKEEVAKAISWIGLEGTIEYNNYIDNYTGNTNVAKFFYITGIKLKIETAKNDCP